MHFAWEIREMYDIFLWDSVGHSPPFWWSALRNWFSSTSKTTCQPAWTLTSLHSEPTDLHRMPSPLPSTQSSHTLNITTPTSQCLLISVQHSVQSPQWHFSVELPPSSPLLFTLYTHDCKSRRVNFIYITSNQLGDSGKERHHHHWLDFKQWRDFMSEEINSLAQWCIENNLLLNISKTKELIIDFRKMEEKTSEVYINGTEVEQVNSFRFLGISITKNLSWSSHISTLVKKAQKRLYFF